MGQALYRTYRSKNLSEIVGQEHITTALKNALKKGTIAHAYLFTGPKGVGKTSIARILAHEINELPYEDDSMDLDIIEIDAASNRRIDEIRNLRDKVHIAPTHGKFKVYIIDEVHMLTREAFNALLKTLEEPPAHAVFILATTEVHKLPETIISRTQHYSFRPAGHDALVGHLRFIAKQEHINITDDALELLARHSDSSFRNGVSLLDQLRNSGQKVTLEDVQTSLGIAPGEMIDALMQHLGQHDASAVVEDLAKLQARGSEAGQIARQLGQSLREALLTGRTPMERELLMRLLGQLLEVPAAHDPRTFLELSLIDAALSGNVIAVVPSQPPAAPLAPAAPAEPTHARSNKKTASESEAPSDAPSKTIPQTVEAKPAAQVEPHPSSFARQHAAPAKTGVAMDEPAEATHAVASSATLSDESWRLVLSALKQTHVTLANALKSANTTFAPGTITVEVATAFLQKRINSPANKNAILDTIQQTTGEQLQVACVVGEAKHNTADIPPLPPSDGEIVHSVAAPSAPAANDTSSVSETTELQPTITETISPDPAKPAPHPAADTAQPQPGSGQAPPALISNIFGSAELLQS